MITQQTKLPDLVPIELQEKIANLSNIQYRAIGLLMLDAGLRPCETTQLQMRDFNFEAMEIKVLCAGRRNNQDVYRTVKMTKRLLRAIGEQWKSIKNPHPHAYLFPARNLKTSSSGHLQAKQLSRWFRKNIGCMPKSCRHTFATRIVNGTKDIRTAKELLGHESQLTTELYLRIPQQELNQAIETIEIQSWKEKWKEKLFPKKQTIFWQPFENGTTKFHIGRETEIAKMTELMNKKVNILLVGEHGVGKTHILENIPDLENRILRIDDLKSTARQMKALVMELFIRLPDMADMMFQNKFRKAGIVLEGDPKEMAETVLQQKEELIGKILSRDSIANLIDLSIRITDKFQYTIIFDDLTALSKNSVIALEKLKNHFHIIAAARQVKIGHQSAISNFQKIEIKPLSRPEAMDLVHKMSTKFNKRIEDYELYKNHIWEQTAGNPLYIYELVDRYQKETYVDVETVRDIQHTSGLKEVNLFPLIIGLIGCFSALRYIGKASGSDPGPFYMLAGIGMIFLFFGREMMRYGKRKWV